MCVGAAAVNIYESSLLVCMDAFAGLYEVHSVRKSLKVKIENILPFVLGGVAKKKMYSINGRE